MESLVKGENEGYRNDAVLSSADLKLDLSAWKGRYVKIRSDNDLYFVFAEDNTGALEITAGVKTVGTAHIPDAVAGGLAGVQRHVSAVAPWIYLRGISATCNVTIKPASEVVSN